MADQSSANNFIICLDVPAGFEFGIDYESFRIGEKFKGVKLVPSGLHFIFYSNFELGIRQGIFLSVNNRDVFIRKYNRETEDLDKISSQMDINNLKEAVRNSCLDNELGLYPEKHLLTWQKLSSYITSSLLERCNIPLDCVIMPGEIPDEGDNLLKDNELIPYFPNVARIPRFTDIRTVNLSIDMKDPSLLTQYHFDTSKKIRHLIETIYAGNWNDLLGELQLSFVIFFLLSSYGALEQWKKLIALLCSADKLILDESDFYIHFLHVLRAQLEQIPKDFFIDPLSHENFLKGSLASLMENLDSIDHPKFCQEKNSLKVFLKNHFNLEFEIMGTFDFADDDCAPALVMPYDLL